ncbi:MAG: PAS domain S-box protein [bacterium]
MLPEKDENEIKAWPTEQEEDSWERLRFLADICRRTSQPFWVGHLDGRIIAFNRRCCELLGYPEVQLRTMDWAVDLTPLEWRETEARALEYLLLTGQPLLYEKEYIRHDGTRVPVEMFVHPVCDFEGNIQYYYAFITDITGCRRIKREILGSRRQWEQFITIGSTVIYSCKPTGDYACTFMSQEVKALFGYESAEFTADPGFWINHIHRGDAPHVLAVLSRLTKEEYHTLDFRFRHKNGTYQWVHNALWLVRNSNGNPQEIIGRWIGITGGKQLENAQRGRSKSYRRKDRIGRISPEDAKRGIRAALR